MWIPGGIIKNIYRAFKKFDAIDKVFMIRIIEDSNILAYESGS